MKLQILLTITIFSWTLCSCSSVFYHPDQVVYVDVKKLKVSPESLSLPAADGTPISAWHFKSPLKRKGIIVHFHGNAQNMTSHFSFLSSAPFQGYDHLIFDYRGYGKTPGKPTPKNTVSDSIDVLRWTQKKFSETPIIVFGQSLGGAIALRALIELRNEFSPHAVIIDSSFTSYRSVARTILQSHWITWPLQPLGWLIVDNSMAPGEQIKELKPTPFLIVHGKSDPVVAHVHGERIYSLAPSPKDLWLIEGGRHTDFMFRQDFRKRFYEFLEQNLSPRDTASLSK